MELHDSYRYQEAVQRLKKLLCDESVEPVSSIQSSHFEEKYGGYSSTQAFSSFHKDWPKDGGGVKSSALYNESEDILRRKRKASSDGVWCLMELLRHQEELIGQLEKENEFLKREIISVSDSAKKVAEKNQDLNRRLAKALSEALAQDEANDSSCSSQAENITPEPFEKLKREKVSLMAEVERLQSVLDATTEREQSALDKLRAALTIAEETQAFTTRVRTTSESAIEELSGLLRSTKEEGEELKRLLEEANKKTRQHEEEQDEWKSQQQKRIKLLQEEINDQNMQVSQLEGEVREKGRQIVVLKDDLQAAQAAKARIEIQLEEQRQHSKDAHARLDHIIMTRGAEAASATTRARELEDRLSSARQDINRLLSTISSIAQGPGKVRDLQSTDDVKSERLAAEQQMSDLLSSLQDRHEEEVKALHDASAEHRKSVDALRQEILEMRQQMTEDNEKHWQCLQRVGHNLGTLSSNYGNIADKSPLKMPEPTDIDRNEKIGIPAIFIEDVTGMKVEDSDTTEESHDVANIPSGVKKSDLPTENGDKKKKENGKSDDLMSTEQNLPKNDGKDDNKESKLNNPEAASKSNTQETKGQTIPEDGSKSNTEVTKEQNYPEESSKDVTPVIKGQSSTEEGSKDVTPLDKRQSTPEEGSKYVTPGNKGQNPPKEASKTVAPETKEQSDPKGTDDDKVTKKQNTTEEGKKDNHKETKPQNLSGEKDTLLKLELDDTTETNDELIKLELGDTKEKNDLLIKLDTETKDKESVPKLQPQNLDTDKVSDKNKNDEPVNNSDLKVEINKVPSTTNLPEKTNQESSMIKEAKGDPDPVVPSKK